MPMMINILIFFVGLLVYAGYGIPGLIYILSATLVSYGIGLLMKRRRFLMWIGIAINAGMLLMIKLEPLTGVSLLAVLGISYFSLQIIGYLADIYRGKIEPAKNICRYALFSTYLPHLFVGPIQKYDRNLFANRRITWEGIGEGAARALWGAFKKLVIASRVGVIVSAISAAPEEYAGAYALAAMLLYSLQLYSDFSGGIDIVLGISRMLGLNLSENFDAPYLSQSFQEFWRRWHITLGTWLREYIYIPLGGNRKGKFRKTLNLIITFLVSGIWHGIQYLLWGVINGIFVAFGTKMQTRWKHLNRVITFILISLLWSFFVWPDALTAGNMVLSVFTTFNYGDFFAQIETMGLTSTDWIVLGAAAIWLWCYDVWAKPVKIWFASRHAAVKTAVICTLALMVLVFGMYGIGFEAGAFIYSRF